jgi:serine/threonine-protein kinase
MSADQELRDVSLALGDRYTTERELGRGGMGTVYLARDLQLDRNVAIKVLPREFAADVMLRERFVRETRVAASFSHPNIVPVHAVEEREGLLAFVMGFVEGESLSQRVARAGPLSARECVRLLQDIAYALAYAHGRGVVHRDIKPDNIMLERATGRALLMDFGVSRGISSAANPAMTRIGEVVGTPEFMSPEQAAGEELDGRSDLYSLGLTAYFGLLGKPAFSGDSAQRLLVRQLTESVPPLSTLRADLPPALSAAIDRCLLKDREARFADAAALVGALDVAGAAAPEVPVQIRVFAQEVATLGIVLMFAGIFIWILLASWASARGSDDALLPVAMLVAIMAARIAQTYSEARRLFEQGFTVEDVLHGFQAMSDEREGQRQALRAHAPTREARKRTVRIASLMLIAAPVLFYFALKFRTKIGERSYHVALPGMILVFTSLLFLGFSLPLLMRNPLRKPGSERLFNAFWLGAPGRFFFRSAARRAAKRGDTIPRGLAAVAPQLANTRAVAPVLPAARPAALPEAVPAAAASLSLQAADADRIANLEARLARLERTVTQAG